MHIQYCYMCRRPFSTEAGIDFSYSFGEIRDTKAEAIADGEAIVESDDFNLCLIKNNQIFQVNWYDEKLEESDEEIKRVNEEFFWDETDVAS